MNLIERKDPGLFRKVGDQIVLKPESYDQGVWAKILDKEETAPACSTVMCVAGHTVTFHPGFKRFLPPRDDVYEGISVVVEEDGQERTYRIPALAAEMLGFGSGDDQISHEAARLFSMAWRPEGDGPLHERVRDALYKIADGASVESVTG